MFPLASTAARAKPRTSKAGQPGAFDRAPALQEAAERVVTAMVKSLQTMAGAATSVEGTLVGFRSMPLRDLLASHRPGSVAAAIECPGLPCTLLATLDPALVHGIVELLCGGNGVECRPDEMRPSTTIDTQYAHIAATLAAGAVAAEWKAQNFAAAKAVKIEGTPAADVCGPRVAEVGVLTFAYGLFGLRGLLTLALPGVALVAFETAPAAKPADPIPVDPAWSSHLHQEVGRANVDVQVLLNAVPLSLRQLSELRIGQILSVPTDARTRAAVVCDGRTLYRGEIGQDEERYCVRIDEITSNVPPASPSPVVGRNRPLQDLIKA